MEEPDPVYYQGQNLFFYDICGNGCYDPTKKPELFACKRAAPGEAWNVDSLSLVLPKGRSCQGFMK